MMTNYSSNSFQENWKQRIQLTPELDPTGTDRLIQTRIRIRIPKHYNEEPVISRIVSEHGVTVNIAAAFLGANARDDGWFDLELRGKSSQIQSALMYLNEMDLEIWGDSYQEKDGW
jgi:ABC-type methionine transport system ATPase subunit